MADSQPPADAAYRSAPKMPSPKRILAAMEFYRDTAPIPENEVLEHFLGDHMRAEEVLDEIRKVVDNG